MMLSEQYLHTCLLEFGEPLAVPLTNSDVTFSSQLLGIISINVFVLAVSFIVWIAMKQTIGIRLSAKAERLGTDVSEVGVVAYAIRD